jgi:TPR repeat protein
VSFESQSAIRSGFKKYFLFFFGILWLMFVLSACQSSKLKTTNHSDFLTEDQIGSLASKANGGDIAAAIKLSNYYGFAKYDMERQIEWLTKAAEDGDAQSQYNLGICYTEGSHADLAKAKFWFQKAESNGVAKATTMLDELQAKKP